MCTVCLFIKYYPCVHFLLGSYLQEAPVITDKPEIVYVMENQSVTITITLNHVNAAVIWRRYLLSSLLLLSLFSYCMITTRSYSIVKRLETIFGIVQNLCWERIHIAILEY